MLSLDLNTDLYGFPAIDSTKHFPTHNETIPASQATCIQAVKYDQGWRGRGKGGVTTGFTEEMVFALGPGE